MSPKELTVSRGQLDGWYTPRKIRQFSFQDMEAFREEETQDEFDARGDEPFDADDNSAEEADEYEKSLVEEGSVENNLPF